MISGSYPRGDRERSGNSGRVNLPQEINLRWSFNTAFDLSAQPFACARRVWAASYDLFESTTTIFCFDQATGECLWQQSYQDQLADSLFLAGEQLILPFSQGRILSVNVSNGAQFFEKSELGTRIINADKLDENRCVVFSRTPEYDPLAFIVDSRNGSVISTLLFTPEAFGGSMSLPPAFDGQRIFLVYGSDIAVFDGESGVKLWQHHFAGSILSGPVIANQIVYVGDNYEVTGLEVESGKIWRKFEIDHGRFGKKDSPLPISVIGDRLFAGMDSNCLQVFSIDSAKVLASIKGVKEYAIADEALWAVFADTSLNSWNSAVFEVDLNSFTRKRGPIGPCSSGPVFTESLIIVRDGSTMSVWG